MRIILVIFLSLAFQFFYCEKKNVNAVLNDVDAIFLKNSDEYRYALGISGDEEGAVICKQATHFELSEILRNQSTKWEGVYIYKSQKNYTGQDYVEIELRTGSNGAIPSTNISVVKISFVITQ